MLVEFFGFFVKLIVNCFKVSGDVQAVCASVSCFFVCVDEVVYAVVLYGLYC